VFSVILFMGLTTLLYARVPQLINAGQLSFANSGAAAAQQETQCTGQVGTGLWSTEAVDLCTSMKGTAPTDTRNLLIRSPDHKKVIHVVGEEWWLEIGDSKFSLGAKASYLQYPAELSWAPSSNAFYITWGDGNIAGFVTELYRVEDKIVRRLPDVNPALQEDFNRNHKCVFYNHGKDVGDDPNVAGLKWVNDSSQLILVAEVPPEGICEQAGYFGGYLVSASDGRILKRFSPLDLEKAWGTVFGDRLRGDFEGLTSKEKTMVP